MTLIVDAGALYAQANRLEPRHEEVVALLDAEADPLVTSEAAAQEADYLMLTRLGIDVELAFLEDLADGAIEVACLDTSERRLAADLAARYRDLALGLADVSLVVLAHRHRTARILTLNERHFRAVQPLRGAGAFTILPADA